MTLQSTFQKEISNFLKYPLTFPSLFHHGHGCDYDGLLCDLQYVIISMDNDD